MSNRQHHNESLLLLLLFPLLLVSSLPSSCGIGGIKPAASAIAATML
jgi:hypothetical protein